MSNIVISPQSGVIEFNNGTAGSSSFSTSTAPIRLDATGGNVWFTGSNVGIGVTNPDRKVVIDAGAGYPLKVNSTQEYLMGLARNGTEQWWFKVNTGGDFTIHENAADDRFRIKAGGNVGIGVADPVKELQVDGSILGKNNGGFLQYDAQGNIATLLNLTTANELSVGQALHVDSMSFNVGGTDDAIFIDSSANVGINVSDPDEKLEVAGKTHLGGRGQDGGAYIAYATLSETQGGAATILGNAVYAGTGSNVYRKTYGDAGNFISLHYNKGITFHTNVTGSAGSTEYNINNHEQMRLTTGGSVGIGTDAPTAQYDKTLHIEGENPTFRAETTYSAGWAYSQYVSPETTWSVGIDNNDKYIIANSATLSSNVKFVVDDANGFVGIGSTSPQTILDVDGSANHGIRIGSNNALIGEGGSTGTQLIFWNGTSAYYGRSAAPFNHTVSNHFFRVGGNDIAMIGSAGVGIGTTSPAHQLHLNKENAIAEMQISRDGSDPSTDTDIGRIQFKTDYSSSPNEVGSIWVRTNSSAYRTDMRFGVKATAGSEEVGLTIHGTNDGPFVGVGTTNPTQTFHVKAEQDGDYVARITNTEATAGANYGIKSRWRFKRFRCYL